MRLSLHLSIRHLMVGVVTSLALAVAGLPVLASPPAAAAPVSAAQGQPGADVVERPDSVSAMVSARAVGHRVEDLSQRSETMQVFAMPDGTWTQEEASGPVRARKGGSGEWAPIDTHLVKTGDGLAPANTLGGLVLSGGGDRTFAQMQIKGRGLQWRWPEVLPAPLVDGDTATYRDVVVGFPS